MEIIKLLICFLPVSSYVSCDCSRGLSRIVRSVFTEKIAAVFRQRQQNIMATDECPFTIKNDIYGLQETYKRSDTYSKWVCEFCGKSFYDEQYLDRHFDRKHSNKLARGLDHVACLADYCDIFRCDVVTGRVVAQYWDMALCKESELIQLRHKCEHILSSCIPKHVNESQRNSLLDQMNVAVCSYLTCDKYWESLDQDIPRSTTALYIIAAVFVLFGLLIYYFVAYSHFYTDESLMDVTRHHHPRSYNGTRSTHRDSSARYRPRQQ